MSTLAIVLAIITLAFPLWAISGHLSRIAEHKRFDKTNEP